MPLCLNSKQGSAYKYERLSHVLEIFSNFFDDSDESFWEILGVPLVQGQIVGLVLHSGCGALRLGLCSHNLILTNVIMRRE